jgi:hypothetical protein
MKIRTLAMLNAGSSTYSRTTGWQSWQRIIDVDALTESDWNSMETKSIQACFWRLDLNQVKAAKWFATVGGPRCPACLRLP